MNAYCCLHCGEILISCRFLHVVRAYRYVCFVFVFVEQIGPGSRFFTERNVCIRFVFVTRFDFLPALGLRP